MLTFEIIEIKCGWFGIRLTNVQKNIEIDGSYYLGSDGPKELLKILAEMFNQESYTRDVYWDNEPGEYLWEFTKLGDDLLYGVYFIDRDENDYQGTDDEKETLISGKTSFNDFISCVLNEFKNYMSEENMEIYKKEWFEFPKNEVQKLFDLMSIS